MQIGMRPYCNVLRTYPFCFLLWTN